MTVLTNPKLDRFSASPTYKNPFHVKISLGETRHSESTASGYSPLWESIRWSFVGGSALNPPGHTGGHAGVVKKTLLRGANKAS